MAEVIVADVARAVVDQLSAAESGVFDVRLREFRRSPRAARPARRTRSEPAASGIAIGAEATGTLALAVGAELANALLAGGGARRRRWWASLRPRATSVDAVATPLTEADIPDLQEQVWTLCKRRGESDAAATAMAMAFAAVWPRTIKA